MFKPFNFINVGQHPISYSFILSMWDNINFHTPTRHFHLDNLFPYYFLKKKNCISHYFWWDSFDEDQLCTEWKQEKDHVPTEYLKMINGYGGPCSVNAKIKIQYKQGVDSNGPWGPFQTNIIIHNPLERVLMSCLFEINSVVPKLKPFTRNINLV